MHRFTSFLNLIRHLSLSTSRLGIRMNADAVIIFENAIEFLNDCAFIVNGVATTFLFEPVQDVLQRWIDLYALSGWHFRPIDLTTSPCYAAKYRLDAHFLNKLPKPQIAINMLEHIMAVGEVINFQNSLGSGSLNFSPTPEIFAMEHLCDYTDFELPLPLVTLNDQNNANALVLVAQNLQNENPPDVAAVLAFINMLRNLPRDARCIFHPSQGAAFLNSSRILRTIFTDLYY